MYIAKKSHQSNGSHIQAIRRYTCLLLSIIIGLSLSLISASRTLAQETSTLTQQDAFKNLLPIPPIQLPRLGPNIDQDGNILSTAFIPNSSEYPLDFAPPTETGRWIRVVLSKQTVLAYQGYEPVRGFIISSGKPETPTVTGQFTMISKVRIQDMTGNVGTSSAYWIQDVEWVQYFYGSYAFHASTHNHFGNTFSNGCINMARDDAKWLFDYTGPYWDGEIEWLMSHWSNPGTTVIVHQ